MKEIHKQLSAPLLRWSMGIVFLYFGISQVYRPDDWAGYVPELLTQFFLSANNLVMINGILEIVLGAFLILGLYTRLSALILSLHLFGIALSLGLNPTGIRDFGLAAATLTIFINGVDAYCADTYFKKKR